MINNESTNFTNTESTCPRNGQQQNHVIKIATAAAMLA